MKVIVLGAGIIGTASAWFLHRLGHEVTVIERQPGPAQETSFANGGQISVSHAEPWANPSAPLKILKWLNKEDAPLLYRFRPEPLQWRWGLQFLRECTASRTKENIRRIVAIAEYSRQTLQAVRKETGLHYDELTRGILHFYTDRKDFEASLPIARLMRELGCPRESISADEVVRIEPALAPMRDKIVGGDFTPSDESGNAYQFTVGLARCAAEAGVQFRFNTSVTRLITEGGGTAARIAGAEVINAEGRYEILHADAFVTALGSFTAPLLKPLGIKLLIYPGKGYSATYRIVDPAAAPTVSLTDDGYKLVFSRLGDHLRVERLWTRVEHHALRTPYPPHPRTVSRRLRLRNTGILDRTAPAHAIERALHWQNALCQPLPQCRTRYTGVDHGLRFRPGDCRYRFRPYPGNRFRFHRPPPPLWQIARRYAPAQCLTPDIDTMAAAVKKEERPQVAFAILARNATLSRMIDHKRMIAYFETRTCSSAGFSSNAIRVLNLARFIGKRDWK